VIEGGLHLEPVLLQRRGGTGGPSLHRLASRRIVRRELDLRRRQADPRTVVPHLERDARRRRADAHGCLVNRAHGLDHLDALGTDVHRRAAEIVVGDGHTDRAV
jgi:hypothetical protein